jgi:hypothetical protein
MAEPEDIILPVLREMRAEIAAGRQEGRDGLRIVERRLDKLEQILHSYRHALTADSLLSKLVTGEFEERIELLERKVRELEGET